MTGKELVELMHQSHRRVDVTGTLENGIIAALDLEGRIFVVADGRVLNRVVPSAIINRTNKTEYLNPGGDVLWPAPEGTSFGYEYGTGKWRVPPSVTGAAWDVSQNSGCKSVITAEIDLVNNLQIGIPCEFERHIEFKRHGKKLIQNITEIIRYIGARTLHKSEFRIAPWSLCQFDSGQGCNVIIPQPNAKEIWDLYDTSMLKRGMSDGKYTVDTKTDFRFQLALSEKTSWIKYIKSNDFIVKRFIGKLPPGQNFIDISDAPPDKYPSDKGVKFSVYCDPSDFMEIEACGGCPEILSPGTELSVNITTEYIVNT